MWFAIICAWTGERELALGQLEAFTKAPGSYTYGNLRLSPLWDPLRGDPRFEKIVSLAKDDVALCSHRNCRGSRIDCSSAHSQANAATQCNVDLAPKEAARSK